MSVAQGLVLIFSISLKISLSQILSYPYYDINSNADGSTFPDPCQTDRGYAVGIDSSGIIHINEGIECGSSSYITYNPITNQFPSSTGCIASCPISHAPVPQYYAQIGDIMYITTGRRFQFYDLNTPSTPYNNVRDSGGSNLNFPTRMESDSMCMAITSDQRYLIGIGGLHYISGDPSPNVQILDLVDQVWIDETSIYLPSTRFGCGAIVHPYNDNLYVAGGWEAASPDDYKNTLWSLYTGDMMNIAGQSWNEYTRDSLARDQFARLIAKDKYLIILGGYSTNTAGIIIWDISGPSPTFLTETLALNGMLWGNAGIATIGDRIYVFGVGETAPIKQWQWIDLKLPSSTQSPTEFTNQPSKAPILPPTSNPTIAPIIPFGETAVVTLHCDNAGTLRLSQDDGNTFNTIARFSNWREATVVTINVCRTTVLEFKCIDNGVLGGFIASIDYDGVKYSTTKPIHGGNFELVSSSDCIISPLVYNTKTSKPWNINTEGIANDAYWIWNGQTYNTMIFQFDFGNIITQEAQHENNNFNEPIDMDIYERHNHFNQQFIPNQQNDDEAVLFIIGLLVMLLITNIITYYCNRKRNEAKYNKIQYVDTDTESVHSDEHLIS